MNKINRTISAEFNLNEKTIQYLIDWLDRQNKLTKRDYRFCKGIKMNFPDVLKQIAIRQNVSSPNWSN